MFFPIAIARPETPDTTPAALIAALQYVLTMTGGWQPPHQTSTSLKSLIGHCDPGSCDERQLMKQARKSGASLIAVRGGGHGLSVDIAYNGHGFWLWHRNLELWISSEDGSCWLIPRDPFAGGMHWAVIDGALVADKLAPFVCGNGRMHGVAAGNRLVRRLTGGM